MPSREDSDMWRGRQAGVRTLGSRQSLGGLLFTPLDGAELGQDVGLGRVDPEHLGARVVGDLELAIAFTDHGAHPTS